MVNYNSILRVECVVDFFSYFIYHLMLHGDSDITKQHYEMTTF